MILRTGWTIARRASLIPALMLYLVGPLDAAQPPKPESAPRPLMRDFMGLNVHTVQFKPLLYAPVCRLLRDYHPVDWDVGGDPTRPTVFPMAANGVDWQALYGDWTRAGYEVDACLMFESLPPAKWKDPARDARAYGEAFARSLGPSGRRLVTSAEVGNEPSKYSAEQYRAIFQGMAGGLRAGDPKLTIATCAVMTGKPDEWSKPLDAIAGLEPLYDVLNVHSYPFKEKWPTWRRSYPEDPSIRFLKDVDDVIRWRDAHAAGKRVWLTEFGYDSATKPPAADGPWKQWVGVSDDEQARYIVRAFLVLSATPLDRAYLYFFNDHDEPQLHGASGITRDFHPKPSFYAMAQLYRALGDYRFVRALAQSEGGTYCFEYEKPRPDGAAPSERVFVAWTATGMAGLDRPARTSLPIPSHMNVYRAERMCTATGEPTALHWTQTDDHVEAEVGESPVYLWAR